MHAILSSVSVIGALIICMQTACNPADAEPVQTPANYASTPNAGTEVPANSVPVAVASPASGDSYARARASCVAAINNYRAAAGKAPLIQRTDQERCADVDAQGDAQSGRAHGESGHCQNSAQNECPGWPNNPASTVPQCAQMMHGEGPGEPYSAHGHYINMMGNYTGMACGFAVDGSGQLWVVQNFY
jgi:hypothetical protein